MPNKNTHKNGTVSKELQELKQKARHVTNESLESTQRMVQQCEEIEEAGIRTVVTLGDQKDQIENISQGLIQINTEIGDAKKNLRKMDSKCCGLCFFPYLTGTSTAEEDFIPKDKKDKSPVNHQHQRMMNDRNGLAPPGGFIPRITNEDIEEEMDENLKRVSSMIGNFRNIAIDIASEVEYSNREVNKIAEMSRRTTESVEDANKSANKVFKRS